MTCLGIQDDTGDICGEYSKDFGCVRYCQGDCYYKKQEKEMEQKE